MSTRIPCILASLLLACGGAPPPEPERPERPPDDGARLAAGGAHTCLVGSAGRVLCWGANERGQLGDGSGRPQSRPVEVAGLREAVEVVAGQAHACARTRGGEVWCWGAGLRGQLGDGGEGEAHQAVTEPVRVRDLHTVVDLAAGALHTCALRQDGRVLCWGDDAAGQLGDGEPASGRSAVPVEVDLEGVRSLAAGEHHTCAVDEQGAVHCWGAGDARQLGPEASEEGSSFPVPVELSEPVEEVAAGSSHTCARTSRGRVLCWGEDARGQLGRGGGAGGTHAEPAPVEELTDAVAIRAGAEHTCARRASDAVWCWGANRTGQLGDGTHADAPRPVETVVSAVEVAAGHGHTCARHDWGAVVCWGSNASGQLGDGRIAWRTDPRPVDELAPVGAIAAGGHHTCALRESAIICWGDNGYGQLGDYTHAARSTPVPSVFTDEPQQVALALSRTCVRDAEGVVSCLGFTGGDARSAERDVQPHAVSLGDLGEVVQVAVARDFACALSGAGAIHCWGANDRGQLGDGTLATRHEPAAVQGAGDAREIAVGTAHACARLVSGAVYCWGANERGQVGDGTLEDASVPHEVPELEDAEQLALGRSHSCARKRDGTVACWGGNAAGQIGDGTTTARSTPTAVRDLEEVEELDAGWLHTCARAGGEVRCWGENRFGQLGRETEGPWGATPAVVGGLDAPAQLAVGGLHSCARLEDGAVRCWGANTHGQLGDGVTLFSARPVLAMVPEH
ncbi:MAG TPA: hypothetical protein RMH99_09265 [Sandaracinaceae bacterium LLY-WYZ-13_1]|nr:hypothetical protein [Sandaracinaceae bacterium LLY-WYZ-13_1]